MEFLKHEHQEKDGHCRRHKMLHCILHATLQVATLVAAIATLHEVEKLSDSVKRLKRAK